ncbi:glycosyltransferase family 9 protein [Arthrobacter sp. KBS0703]|uniref:glycosyltransferase family 9 protein n=1 Tax=Arthrobacter sp. KBS0703 TaxID=1955698 RepID=UPI00098F5F0C|nr:glycosyltransferase family 9 protein [Arthrobacter sp. KBS0703]TSE14231.1 glycosyltransferase family 9 protein [Arthrobacter sp. KBS0703]TSE17120.1 glycosyltransferase family 9 protein [Arthrobacter sp. KBS0703]
MGHLNADFGGAHMTGFGIGPVLEEFTGVSRIAVLRGGGLGDLMYAVPAVTALKAAYPKSTVTLLGTPIHAELLAQVESPVDETAILPFAEGVRPGPVIEEHQDGFIAAMRARNFDLAVQLHGGGRHSNPFLLRLGARHTVGAGTPDAARLERTVPYTYYQHEPLRALEVAGYAGAPPVDLEARLRPRPEFERQLAVSLAGDTHTVVVIHPGATDPRRRWPAQRFAAVARRAADDGFRVLVIGDQSERELAETVVELAVGPVPPGADDARGSSSDPPVASLAGKLSLGELAGLLAGCSVVVANDSGPRHLAQALGTPTVGIFWAGNAINAAPLGRSMHRIHLGWATHCAVCGIDITQVGWTAPRCRHDVSTVETVAADAVYEDVLQLTAMTPRPRGR